jgi:hypothetical protein
MLCCVAQMHYEVRRELLQQYRVYCGARAGLVFVGVVAGMLLIASVVLTAVRSSCMMSCGGGAVMQA